LIKIERGMAFLDGLEELSDLGGIGDVAGEGQHARSAPLQRGGGIVQLAAIASGEDELTALLGQQPGQGKSNAAISAGDESNFVGQDVQGFYYPTLYVR
jgi:hypothetical protein